MCIIVHSVCALESLLFFTDVERGRTLYDGWRGVRDNKRNITSKIPTVWKQKINQSSCALILKLKVKSWNSLK